MNFKNKCLCLIMTLVMSVCFSGCSLFKTDEGTEYPVTINDVTIDKEPKKVIVLSDSLADIVIGLSDVGKVCARSDECTQEAFSKLPSVGSKSNPNLETIKSFDADLILYDSDLPQETVNDIMFSGIKLIKLTPANDRDSLKTLYNNVGKLLEGNITGEKSSDELYKEVTYALDAVTKVIPVQTVSPTVCYLFDDTGKVVNKDMFANNIMSTIRCTNVAADAQNGVMDMNALKAANPSFVFCAVGMKDKVSAALAGTQAVQSGNVHEIPQELLTRQGETILSAAKEMASKVYPDLKLVSDKSTLAKASDLEATKPSEIQSTESQPTEPTQSASIPAKDDIMSIQKRLDDLCYLHTAPDGEMSDSMKQAIMDFKFLNGMDVTAEIDDGFMQKLFSDSVSARPDPAREK